jgi:hypothetical protein
MEANSTRRVHERLSDFFQRAGTAGGGYSFAFHTPNVTVLADFPASSANRYGLFLAEGGTG